MPLLPHHGRPVMQDKRGKVKLHEQAAVGHHVLLLLGSTAHLEHQVLDFQTVKQSHNYTL